MLINVPEGTTIRVQPLDESITKLFKNYVCELLKQQLDAKLGLHVDGKLTAEENGVLTTKWTGEAWERVQKDININKNAVYLTIWMRASMPVLTSRASKGVKCPCPKRSST